MQLHDNFMFYHIFLGLKNNNSTDSDTMCDHK